MVKKTVFGRSAKLIRMATKLAQSEVALGLRSKLKKNIEELAGEKLATRIQQAQVLKENLSQLKGAAMKAGQLLSLDSSDILPPEVTDVLSQLQNSADPIEFPQIESVLKSELPLEVYGNLQDLDTIAFAAASIGQVHRAHFDGQDVVLKVQYPGVVESIDSDLRILRKVVQALLTVSGRQIDLTETFKEFSEILHQEADYKQEFKSTEIFKKLLKSHSDFVVPTPIESLSASKVLGMSYEEGLPILDWIQSNPPKKDRQWAARKILDLYCMEFFEWGVVQTDPNYGNFKIQNDPLKIVLLDFGATLTYDENFRDSYVQLLKDFASFDKSQMLSSALSFGLIDERESAETKEIFVDFLKSAIEPFLPDQQPFYFKDPEYARRANEIGRKFTSSLKYSPPPKQLLFLHRKLGGIFNLIRKMDVELDLRPYWAKMVGQEFKT